MEAESNPPVPGIQRAPTDGTAFPAFEDDDEEFKHFNPIKHRSFEQDDAEEQFKRDLAAAKACQAQKYHDLSQVKSDKTLSAEEAQRVGSSIIADYNLRFRKLVEEQQENWHNKTSEGANFLHYLAYQNPSDNAYPQFLVKMAGARRPELMGVLDGKGRTPLTAAIAEKNFLFCFNAVARLDHAQATYLRSECKIPRDRDYDHDREATCLHAALSATFYDMYRLDRKWFITKIISLVPKEMFTVTDSKGRTPLHLAVQYENCTPDQPAIVEKLLEAGPEALNVETSTELGRSISVFQFHELSRRNGQAKYEKKRSKELQYLEDQQRQQRQREQQQREQMNQSRMRPENPAPSREEKEAKQTPENPKNEAKKTESRPKRGIMDPPPPPPMASLKDRLVDANVAVPRSTSATTSPQTRQPPKLPLAADPRATASPQAGASPITKPQASALTDRREMDEKQEQQRGRSADAISEQLKLLCLRNKEPDSASRFLRSLEGKQDKALWFDFGPSRKLNMKDFNRSFKHFRFESILQYVAFPRTQLLAKDSSSEKDGRNTGAVESSPMVVLFDWLRKKERGVKRIIRVIVDDLEFPSHTDEAVEKALEGFKVEILDWRRPDLCPASLAKIGGCLREVNLYWSGSNPVLRAWSEPEGLAQLPNLERVNIIEVNGIESEARVKENLETFKARLHSSWPKDKSKPQINPPNGGRLRFSSQRGEIQHAGVGASSWHDRRVDPHRWMECMRRFSDEFLQINELREAQKDADPALGPVVVALIDDGTDIHHPDLSMQANFHGQSFYKYQEGSGSRVDPWWHSESGHGTLMARLISGICPSAIIHVIKLYTFYAGDSKKLQIDPDSAIKAIEYATELGAHIISMSWTIKPPEEPAKSRFIQAVNSAMMSSKRILMFCSASDQGKFPDRTFPHAVSSNIFRIGAAAATGKVLDTVGDQQGLSFILPGHEVVVDNWYSDVEDKAFDKFEAHSGSSVATALAAGLAALIIECVRLGVVHTNDSPPEQQLDSTVAIRMSDLLQIREQETMRKALSSIDTDLNTNHLYLKVWDLFEKNADKLKAARLERVPGGQLEIISGLARHFLRKGIT